MKHLLRTISILFLLCVISTQSFAAINFTLTPIRYELEMAPGETKTLPASIKNNSLDTVTLPTATSDFVARDGSGVPAFVRKSELVFEDQQLSTWISLSEPSITLAPGEEKSINFTIQVPEDATPGGHYAAVFFKNPGSETSAGGNIGINVDYGILILLKVKGKIIIDPEIGDPQIRGGFSEIKKKAWYLGKDKNNTAVYIYEDTCIFGDFTTSKFDKKCFENPFDPKIPEGEEVELAQEDTEPLLFENDFEIVFSVPIENKGNMHVKPSGKVVLKDEDGNIIQAIGKESILNEYGAIIGEKVVDYIPFNDEGGNVLPSSTRLFESYWKGFPYQSYDEKGAQVMKYWSPSEYYTKKNKDTAGYLMPWERVSEARQTKKIFADIQIVYQDEEGKDVEFNSAKEFEVQYIEEQITLNPYVILALLLLSSVGLLLWFALRWWFLVVRKHRCWNCKEVIKAHWETCPYCKTLQDKNEHKRFEKQKEASSPTPVKRGRKKKEDS